MFDEDFGATLLGAAAVIGLPAAVIVAGTVAFTDIKISMPSFTKADPIDKAIECYNEIIDTNNQTECGIELVEWIGENKEKLDDPAYKETLEAKFLAKGLNDDQLEAVALAIAFNGMCSEKGMAMIEEEAKSDDKAEQFGFDLGMGLFKGLCTSTKSWDLSKLKKIG